MQESVVIRFDCGANLTIKRERTTMLNTNDKIIKHKTGLLNLAEELGNVSKACQVMSYSHDTFYRYKQAVEVGGVEALMERTRRMVPYDKTGSNCHQHLAQTIQPHPPTSCPEHATTSARNLIREIKNHWYRKFGLDTLLKKSISYLFKCPTKLYDN